VRAFKKLCLKSNVNHSLIRSVEQINTNKKKFLIKNINSIVKKHKVKNIGVIGYTFKENTKVSDESQYEKIIQKLKVPVVNIYDENINFLKINNKYNKVENIYNLLRNNKIIIIFHNKKKYFDLPKKFKKNVFYSVWSNTKKGIKDLNITKL